MDSRTGRKHGQTSRTDFFEPEFLNKPTCSLPPPDKEQRVNPRFSVLHITDIHFGQWAMAEIWPSVKASFLSDLKYILDKSGAPVDLIALSGDVANRAAEEEYALATDFLTEVAMYLQERDGIFPVLSAVPGNHDVSRSIGTPPAQRVLEQLWDDEVDAELFDRNRQEYRDFIVERFQNYAAWYDSKPIPIVEPDHIGRLSGDYTATVETDHFRVGILGLNSTFRHLSDKAVAGNITISRRQIQLACGGDLPAWAAERDFSIILSHHPIAWLSNPEDVIELVFSPDSNVGVHLCGHLHADSFRLSAPGTYAPYVQRQGTSLFGLESVDPGNVSRAHGYSLLTFDRTEETIQMRVWPRAYVKSGGGQRSFDRDPNFGLTRDALCTGPVDVRQSHRTRGEEPAPRSPTGAIDRDRRDSGDDQLIRDAILKHMADSDLVAFIGDRHEAADDGGDAVLRFGAFRSSLWEALETGNADDSNAGTHQLMRVLRVKNPSRLKSIVSYHLGTPPPEDISSMVSLLRAPWNAVVTLSPSAELEPAIAVVDSDGRRFSVFNATRDPYRLPDPSRPFVLRLSSPAPEAGTTDLTLDLRDPEHNVGSKRDWMRYVGQLLARSPVIFLADSISTIALLPFIGSRPTNKNAQRPPAYLVCPWIEPHEEALLLLYGVSWLKSTVAAFASEFLIPGRVEIADGLRRQRHRIQRPLENTALSLDTLLRGAIEGSKRYLLGQAPTWGDVVGGFAAILSLSMRLTESVRSSEAPSLHVVMGTAGSGRTTAMMQSAIQLKAARHNVGWIDSTASQGIPELLEEIEGEGFDTVFIDDVDIFGTEAPRLIDDIMGAGVSLRSVVVGVRSVRAHLIENVAGQVKMGQGALSDEDVDLLISVLRANNAIADRRQSDYDVRNSILGAARGQLLVAMIQATSGLPFNEKIESEFRALDGTEQLVYGVLAVATAERESMTQDQILEAVDADPTLVWKAFNRILNSRLIQRVSVGQRYEVRHRLIAETVRSHLRVSGQLATVVEGVLRAFAVSAVDLTDNSHPDRRGMIRVLNHSYLRKLRLSTLEIRSIYGAVEDILDSDFHYWLQRGSFEVETKNYDQALHALTAAMTTPGGEDDPRVLTEFAYLRLELGQSHPSVETTTLALDAVEDLRKVILRSGESSPHTFVVLAREGVAWLVSTEIGESRRKELAHDIEGLLKLGARLSDTNNVVASALMYAARELEPILAGQQLQAGG